MTSLVRGRVVTTFPATLDGESPIVVTNNGGSYTISIIDDGTLIGGYTAGINAKDQTVAGGYRITSEDLGTATAGETVTLDSGDGPLQYISNAGAFTLAAPANDGSLMLLVTNAVSAGAITFTGFDVPGAGGTGDLLDTVSGNMFTISVWRINSVSGYRIAAHQ